MLWLLTAGRAIPQNTQALHANLTLPGSLIRSARACCPARVDTSENPGSLCTRSSRCPGRNDSACRCSTRSPAPHPPHPRTHNVSPTLALGYNVCVVSTGSGATACTGMPRSEALARSCKPAHSVTETPLWCCAWPTRRRRSAVSSFSRAATLQIRN